MAMSEALSNCVSCGFIDYGFGSVLFAVAFGIVCFAVKEVICRPK